MSSPLERAGLGSIERGCEGEASSACRHLASCRLLKFFYCPLIRSREFLLQFFIQMWSIDLKCFVVRGEQLTFSSAEDIYFLTGLPFWGRALVVDPHLLWEDRVETMRHDIVLGRTLMSGSVVRIEALDDLLRECIAAMVVRIYGSLGTQGITRWSDEGG
jgi:hypothetical protein